MKACFDALGLSIAFLLSARERRRGSEIGYSRWSEDYVRDKETGTNEKEKSRDGRKKERRLM